MRSVALAFALACLAWGAASAATVQDFGADAVTGDRTISVPIRSADFEFDVQGPGSGGGAGSSVYGGGGAGRGAQCHYAVRGATVGTLLVVKLPKGGQGQSVSVGTQGYSPSGHAELRWPSGLVIFAGYSGPGKGAIVSGPGLGGSHGNCASTIEAGGSYPPGVSFGQFNMNASAGQHGLGETGGLGGGDGDTGGGGNGGGKNQPGKNGQGAYIHFEWRD